MQTHLAELRAQAALGLTRYGKRLVGHLEGLGSGVAPVRKMLRTGITVGVGTDASITSDGQNMFEAMRLASYLSRIDRFASDERLSAGEAFHLATEGSAKVIGFGVG